MERTKLLRQLRSLANHPGTPEHERASALARIAELTAPSPAPPRAAAIRGVASGAAHLRGLATRRRRPPAFQEEWPFGWTGPRAPVEYEVAPLANGGLALGWKCPSCCAQVERRLAPHILRQCNRPLRAGETPPLEMLLRRVTGGSQNQLCPACWARWDAA